jgi:hypothetical protein
MRKQDRSTATQTSWLFSKSAMTRTQDTLFRRLWRWYLSALATTGVMEAAIHRPPDRRSNSAKSETQLEAQARDDQ